VVASLGREEGLERARLRLGVHPGAGVGDGEGRVVAGREPEPFRPLAGTEPNAGRQDAVASSTAGPTSYLPVALGVEERDSALDEIGPSSLV
jgi:hypothetical protein